MTAATRILLLALAYTIAGKLGLSLAFVNASATAVWPPTGIALAAFLLLGYRVWPGIFLGAFLVNLMTAGTMLTSLAISGGNTLEGLAAAVLVNRFAGGREVFGHPYGIFKYTILAALGSTMIAATIGTTTLVLGGLARGTAYGPIWITWWLGDAGGDLTVAPLLILWSAAQGFAWTREKIAEIVLAAFALVLAGLCVFGGFFGFETTHAPLEFLCIPIVLWAAFRMGQRETAAAVFLLAALATWGTLRGHGPFADASRNNSLLLLQAYLGVVSVMSLAVAAIIAERRRTRKTLETLVQERTASLRNTIEVLESEVGERLHAEQALQASEIRFQRLLKSNVIGIMTIDGEGHILEANDAFLELLGYPRKALQEGLLNTPALTPAEYHTQEEWAMEQLHERGSCPGLEKEFIHREGSRVPVLVGGVRMEQSPERSVFFVIDATHRRQAMNALRKAYDEIELRVNQRTEELSREIERRQKAETELRNLSLLDPLTGLYNRRGFLALAEQQWLQAFRDKRPLLVFFADLDRLKPINDTLGHQRGDQALIEAAEALRHTFRKSDIVARIGGDEFAIVVAQSPLEHIHAYLERLQHHLDQLNASQRLPFTLALSIGVAEFDQQETTSVQELIRRADENLYIQKQNRSAAPQPRLKN